MKAHPRYMRYQYTVLPKFKFYSAHVTVVSSNIYVKYVNPQNFSDIGCIILEKNIHCDKIAVIMSKIFARPTG